MSPTDAPRKIRIDGKRVAFLVANEGVEQVELTEPWDAVKQAGGRPTLVAPDDGKVQAFHHLDKADIFEPDVDLERASAADYDALVLPGGVANPDQLRMDERAVTFVRDFMTDDKPVAVICHGPWTLVEAGVLSGRTMTSWPSLHTDITNAGAQWVDSAVVVDGHLISSRKPDDLPAFCEQLLKELAS